MKVLLQDNEICEKTCIRQLRESPILNQDFNPGLQLKEMAPFWQRYPDESLGQARTFLLVDPHCPSDRQ